MIPAHVIQKIRRMHIKSRRTVSGEMAGQYRSVFRGSGIEFEELREYTPGDDVKSIDWKTTARLGRPFVKKFREERQSIVMLMVDMSRSLQFGTFSGRKLDKAAEVAAVLAFNAVKNNDRVGLILFTDQVETYIPPKNGVSHIWRVIQEIFTFEPTGTRTDIASGLDYLSRVLKKRAFVFILSDFFDTGYDTALKTAHQRHEVIGVHITDPGMATLPESGLITLKDMETGQVRLVDAKDPGTRAAYEAARGHARTALNRMFQRCGIDVIDMPTECSVSDTLTRYFRQREKRLH